ncbi:cupin domain-containing protein [Variovorax sp. YR752]|uniref:cupin domain-containing protein n=1 Tax=Variovorax sp. YR752 TaxID=1884383 RepID=UPI00313800DE
MTIQKFTQQSLQDFALTVGAHDPSRGSQKFSMPEREPLEFGVWESDVGTFERATPKGELMFILSGAATFTETDGPALSFGAGDLLVVPPNTQGTWVVSEKLRKVYVMA